MSLVEFCKRNGLTIIDKFALECYKQSGECDKCWQLWVMFHCDRQWKAFWKWQHREMMKAAREYEKELQRERKVGQKNLRRVKKAKVS